MEEGERKRAYFFFGGKKAEAKKKTGGKKSVSYAVHPKVLVSSGTVHHAGTVHDRYCSPAVTVLPAFTVH